MSHISFEEAALFYMTEAFKEAKIAEQASEVPVGAIIVKDDTIISRAHNLKETLKDPTAHAEILAIQKACKLLNSWCLDDCDIYVTLEPCPMCAGAIIQARIANIFIGTFDSKIGACGSAINIAENPKFNHISNVHLLHHEESRTLLLDFFRKRR